MITRSFHITIPAIYRGTHPERIDNGLKFILSPRKHLLEECGTNVYIINVDLVKALKLSSGC